MNPAGLHAIGLLLLFDTDSYRIISGFLLELSLGILDRVKKNPVKIFHLADIKHIPELFRIKELLDILIVIIDQHALLRGVSQEEIQCLFAQIDLGSGILQLFIDLIILLLRTLRALLCKKLLRKTGKRILACHLHCFNVLLS